MTEQNNIEVLQAENDRLRAQLAELTDKPVQSLTKTFASQYMLAKFSMSVPDNYPRLNATEAEVAAANGTTKNKVSAHARQIFAECPMIKHGSQIITQFAAYHRQNTTVWGTQTQPGRRNTGPRLLAVTKMREYMLQWKKSKDELDKFMDDFTEDQYDKEIAIAKKALGTLADQITWPDYESIVAKYVFEPSLDRLPADTPLPANANVPQQVVDIQMKMYKRRERKMIENAVRDKRDQLIDRLTVYLNALSKPNGKLYDSVRQACIDMAADTELASFYEYLDKDADKLKEDQHHVGLALEPTLDNIRASEPLRKRMVETVKHSIETVNRW